MGEQQMYCPNCGKKNLVSNKFCQQCGASLTGLTGMRSSISHKRPKIQEQPNIKTILIAIFGGLAIVLLILIGCKGYVDHQRIEIRTCVYKEFNAKEFTVHINRRNKVVSIIPSSEQGSIILNNDVEDLAEYEEAVSRVSNNIKSGVGKGWTIEVKNPFNTSRSLWSIKDGNFKYSIYQELMEDNDDDDY